MCTPCMTVYLMESLQKYHIHTVCVWLWGVYMVFLAGESMNVRLYMVYVYDSGQLSARLCVYVCVCVCVCVYVCVCMTALATASDPTTYLICVCMCVYDRFGNNV